MGSAVSAGRRYNYQRPEVYFELELYPSMKAIFTMLGLTYEEALELFQAFVEIDKKGTGMIELPNFYKYYGIKRTRFTDRVLTFMDKDSNGQLDIKEFVVGIWNYCTYDARQVARVCFGFFDVDNRGVIDMADLDALIRMVYETEDSNWTLILEIFGSEGREDALEIALGTFQDKVAAKTSIIQPAFEFQRMLRKKTFGVNYWNRQQQRRQEEFKNFDESAEESWGGLLSILTVKKKEKPAKVVVVQEAAGPDEPEAPPPEEAAAPPEEDPLEKYRLPEETKFADEQIRTRMIVQREREEFNERRFQALKAEETADDDAERLAWNALEEAKGVLLNTRFTLEQAAERTLARRAVWRCMDDVMEKTRNLARIKEEVAIELARGPDAEAKCTAYISTELGKRRYDWEIINQYGHILHETFNDNLVLQLFAGMFEAPPGRVPWATSAVFKYLRQNRTYQNARRRARQVLLDEIREKDYQLVKKTWAEKALTREHDFNDMEEKLVVDFGTRQSRWEKLWDPVRNSFFYLHTETNEKAYGEVAICEKCDAKLMPEDSRCLNCQAFRSAANKGKYRSLELTVR